MKLITAVVMCSVLLFAGCTTRTEFGPCVGIGEKQNSQLDYKLSGWNIAMGVIFFEMIAPPILVLTDETYCPVGKTDESH